MDKYSITLLFQIITAVGSLSTFGAFLYLFRRDKDKQAQIDKLTQISTFLEAQNEVMKEHNNLISQQVDIFRNTSILRNQDDVAVSQLKDIEEKKLRLSVKPNLWLNGAGYEGHNGELKIDLNNKGENAKLKEFKLNSSDIVLHNDHLPWDLDKGERRYIFARSNGNNHIKDAKYTIEIIYEDKLGNNYSNTINGEGANVVLSDTIAI